MDLVQDVVLDQEVAQDQDLGPETGILFEMGPFAVIGAHIKTGRSQRAQGHFQTCPDPKRGYNKF